MSETHMIICFFPHGKTDWRNMCMLRMSLKTYFLVSDIVLPSQNEKTVYNTVAVTKQQSIPLAKYSPEVFKINVGSHNIELNRLIKICYIISYISIPTTLSSR